MKTLKQKVEAIMNDSGVSTGIPMERLLLGISRCYGGVMKIRDHLYRKSPARSQKLPCPVISIGNITVGGTGKTPMTVYLAKMLKNLGCRIAIVSRGYGGKASKTGGIVCDGQTILLEADMAGDEPYMMAQQLGDVPILVGSNRYASGLLAVERFAPDVILLDDGFQHRRVKRDLDILLLDADRPFGNGHMLPRGTLREPVEMIRRADIMILTRSGSVSAPEKTFQEQLSKNGIPECAAQTPLFLSSHEPYLHRIIAPDGLGGGSWATPSPNDASVLKGKSVFAFSGIAKNQDFHLSAEKLGCRMAGHLAFSDHHAYRESDFADIIQSAKNCHAQMIITTEKDYARISGHFQGPLPLAVIGVAIAIQEEKTFQNLISEKIRHDCSQ